MLPANVQKVLAIGLLLGLFTLHGLIVVGPASRQVMSHAIYTPKEIRDGDIRVERLVGRRTAVFSNGDRRHFGFWTETAWVVMWLVGFLAAAGVVAIVSRRFLPAAHAEFFRRRPPTVPLIVRRGTRGRGR